MENKILWRHEQPLVLASKSTTRLSLLVHAGVPVETVSLDIDERGLQAEVEGRMEPDQIALMLARAKAISGSKASPGRIVLGADQTLALGSQVFHKPLSMELARKQLQDLSGTTHALHSAAAVVIDGEPVFETVSSAYLTMRELSDDMLDTYLTAAGQRVMDSVGGYQIEAVGLHLFARVQGDHFTILGLPLLQILPFFRERGFLP